MPVRLIVNGEEELYPSPISIEDLASKKLEDNDSSIAISLNLKVIKREQWENTLCQNNDSIEIIEAAQGG